MINRKLLQFFDHCEAAAFHLDLKVFGKYNIGFLSHNLALTYQGLFVLFLIAFIYIVSEQSIKLPFPVFAVPIFAWYIYFSFFLDIPRKKTEEEKLEEFLKLRKGLRVLFYFISLTPFVLALVLLAFASIEYFRRR